MTRVHNGARTLAATFLSLITLVHCQKFFQPTFSVNFTLNGFLNDQGGYVECEEVAFQVVSLDGVTTPSVVPPLYMITVETNGATSLDSLGSDLSNIVWTIRHTRGTLIYYYLVDSEQNMSKVFSTSVYNGTTDCLPSASTPSFTASVDKSQVNYCDYLTMDLSGGTKPYSVTAFGSDVTNYTLNVEDDIFKFVNNIGSGFFLIVASDANGQWATGQNYINSIGSNSSSCPSQSFGTHSSDTSSGSTSSSSSGTFPSSTALVDGSSSTSSASEKKAVNVGAIVGGIVGGFVFFASILGAVFICLRRRGNTNISTTNATSTNLNSNPNNMNQYQPFVTNPFSNHVQGTSAQAHPMMHSTASYTSPNIASRAIVSPPNPNMPPSNYNYNYPSSSVNNNYPNSSINASVVSPQMLPEVYSSPPTEISTSHAPATVTSVSTPSVSSHNESIRNDTPNSHYPEKVSIIQDMNRRALPPIQHEDAEDVADLPPAYRDRVGQSV